MARYRKIDIRLWGDEKFKNLSPMGPCGQGLWFYLLTGPHTGMIPGVIVCGPAAMAESLEWPIEGFREAFEEAFRQGMVEADWKARLVWVPKAIYYNFPESPNVIRSWVIAWDETPECALKTIIYEHLRTAIEAKGDAFLKAFDEACPKPFGKPSGKPLAKAMANQEQEHEQEQDNNNIPPTPFQGEQPGRAQGSPHAQTGSAPAGGKAKGKPSKPAKPKGRDYGIAALEMPQDVAEEFERVWNGWPLKGWNYTSKTSAPRRINYAEAAKRFYEVLQFNQVEKADGTRMTSAELANAALGFVSMRIKESGGPTGVPNVPCIANFFSAAEGKNHPWKEAVLTFFGMVEAP